MGEFVDAVMQDDFELGVSFFLCVLFSVGPKRLAVDDRLVFGLECWTTVVRGSRYLVVRAIYVRFCTAHRE